MVRLDLPEKFDLAAKKNLIQMGEERFERQLGDLTRTLLSKKDLKVVSLCGPSCAGKTTTAKKIIAECEKAGRRVVTLSIDDFYKDRWVLVAECEAKGVKTDYESVDAIDVDYLGLCFDRIFKVLEAQLPVFDFTVGERVGYRPYRMREQDLLLLEGIQAMYPAVRALIEKHSPFYVFIDAIDILSTPYGDFDGRELRLCRRLVRDFSRRNSSAENTFDLWKQVVENEEKSIYPYKGLADFTISSTMVYEPMMLKKPLKNVLGMLKATDRYAEKAGEILRRFEHFPQMDDTLLPDHSVYHEFI